MSKPEVMLCPDGHYHHAMHSIRPYIADYLEQVLLACIVQDWCPLVLGSPVPRLKKDCNWTGPRPQKTGPAVSVFHF